MSRVWQTFAFSFLYGLRSLFFLEIWKVDFEALVSGLAGGSLQLLSPVVPDSVFSFVCAGEGERDVEAGALTSSLTEEKITK